MMTEKKIQKALLNKFMSHYYKFINVFYFNNESDFLSFLPNGYCYEVEVKISRSDFKADFKKPRHNVRYQNNNGKKYYVEKRSESSQRLMEPTWEFCKHFPDLVVAEEYHTFRTRKTGETEIRLYYTPCTEITIREIKNLSLPNKFFYAVPKGLISVSEIPDYAGLLYVDENGNIEKVKDGKFLHRDLLSADKLFNKCYNEYANNLYQRLKNID